MYGANRKTPMLRQSMRQSDADQQGFRGLLAGVRNCCPTEDHFRLCQSRFLNNLGTAERSRFEKNAIRLFPTNLEKDQYNLNRLKEHGKPVAVIKDSIEADCLDVHYRPAEIIRFAVVDAPSVRQFPVGATLLKLLEGDH